MRLEFVKADGLTTASDGIAALVFEDGPLTDGASRLDQLCNGALTRAIAAAAFTGAKGKTLELVAPAEAIKRALLVGAGDAKGFDDKAAEKAAAEAYNALKTSGVKTLRLAFKDRTAGQAAYAALGVTLAAYRFDRYRTKEKPEKKPTIETVEIAVDDVDAAKAAFAPLSALADGVIFTRDLVSEPANVLYPEEFARRVKALEPLGLSVEILGEAEMAKLGMGSLLGVGQGSVRDSQLAVIQWKGAADPKAQPIAFVGKGVCFDPGGISLKPADGMAHMIWYMGGAGAVAGLMHAQAARKAKVNAIRILGLVQNMTDVNAYRPADILTSMSGQTIEVINTDAEGRLVLADAGWYCQERFKPKFVIDLATLTGAIVVALCHDLDGMYMNEESLAENLLKASEASGDALWRMPLQASYDKNLDSLAADMKNTGGRPGGSITAALFIQRFTNGVPWAHLDIAGTAWKKPSAFPTSPDGATGFGVRLLNDLVAANYED